MHSLNNRGVHSENLRIFPNCDPNTMDYRQKMVVPSSQKLKHEDDDDEDLEALRLAALKSLRAKHTLHSTRQPSLLPQQVKPRPGYLSYPVYNHQRPAKRGYYQNRLPRQNGNTYCPSRVNHNLIEIVPVEEEEALENDIPRTDSKTIKTDTEDDERAGESKFYRYKDNPSGSEEEDGKESTNASAVILTPIQRENIEKRRGDENGAEKECHKNMDKSPREAAVHEDICEKMVSEKTEVKEDEEEEAEEDEDDAEDEGEEEEDDEEEEKTANDDDDDVLLMADLEEEDSLERLMDEMEREMNVDKFEEAKEKVSVKKDSKESRKTNDTPKVRNRKSRIERKVEKNGATVGQISSSSSIMTTKNEPRSVSPRPAARQSQKRRSLSPKPRSRKKSPRRSPRRSPSRLLKKSSFRDAIRMRSPRKISSPPSSRFSPRPRSPKLSPRCRSPSNRSPIMRRCSPPRKLSPRGRSPHSRSPRNRRSRSPGLIARSRSPQTRLVRSPKRSIRSRSPRVVRSRSPRARTPRSTSPRISPLRTNSPRCRSPRLSPKRLVNSPRPRSPKQSSPERRRGSPLRLRSPLRHSPHRSPWSSPRNSPRMSPRRRRTSPKESTRKPRQRSITPDETPSVTHKRESSPVRRNVPSSPDAARTKGKHKDSAITTNAGSKDNIDLTNDPIFEARRRKFENTKPIDPIHDNKKIKLGKKDTASKTRLETTEEVNQIVESPKIRKSNKAIEEDWGGAPETDLCQTDDYVYEVVEDVISDASSAENTVSMCVEMVPLKVEKERSKKKKKRDKVLYQVGKLKGELPLSERIGKEKKCKKRRDRVPSPVEGSPERETVVEDLTTIDEEEADLRTELSRRRAERLNRAAPVQSARLLQSAFKGVVNEVAKTNAKVIQRHATKGSDKKTNKKEVRRVTVLHRTVTDVPDSDDEATVDSKVPVRFRLGVNKPTQENSRDSSKAARKSSKRQGRNKVKHKNNMSLTDQERKN